MENSLKIKVFRKSILFCKYHRNGNSDLYEILCGGNLVSFELKFQISWKSVRKCARTCRKHAHLRYNVHAHIYNFTFQWAKKKNVDLLLKLQWKCFKSFSPDPIKVRYRWKHIQNPGTIFKNPYLVQGKCENPFTLKKCGCLQKTRAQSVKIWPRYKGFKWKKNIFKNFHLFALQTKNAVNQRVFKIFPKFFFYMVSYYPLILYGV